jgi:hypothetical protein
MNQCISLLNLNLNHVYIIYKFEFNTIYYFTICYLVFTLYKDEFAWDELLLLRFYHYYFYF